MRVVFAAALVCLAPALVWAATAAPPQPACSVQPPGGKWSDAGQWIGGINSGAFAAGLTPEQRDAWNGFSRRSNADWSRFQKQYLDHIALWRSHYLPNAAPDLAFYPFGGPDAVNLLAFYPDAREYLMVGLEPVGCVPTNIPDYTTDYFDQLRHGLNDVVAMGFFITDNMRRDVTHTDLNGVLPLLVFLISRSGYTIDSVTPIAISPDGAVGPSATMAKQETSGVAIQFSDSRHGARVLRYFSLNLANAGLQRKPGSTKFLSSLPESETLLKAASYLMHKPNFSTIRATILAKTRVLAEEDSGIPFRYFDAANWEVHLYGAYTEPIKLFKNFEQDDLKAAYASGTGVQSLDFGVGYRHRDQSNLLVAFRKGK